MSANGDGNDTVEDVLSSRQRQYRQRFDHEAHAKKICFRFPLLRVCGCTIPCRRMLRAIRFEQIGGVNIIVGPLQGAFMVPELLDNNITHVVNVSNVLPYEELGDLFRYTHINVEDETSASLSPYFMSTCLLIDEVLRRGGGVYVHCRAGISRSVTLVCAFLIWKRKGITPEDALLLVRQSRGDIANPNETFRKELVNFYETHGGEGESLQTSSTSSTACSRG